MMRLTETAVGEIRACQNVYRQADVARAYGVHESSIHRIWKGQRHRNVPPAPEPPNIDAEKAPEYVKDDVMVLSNRGMTISEIASELGISQATVYRCLPRWYFG